MDGIHDLGGKQGFGPIDVTEPEEPFHAPWEARSHAIARTVARPPTWTIDRFRFVRECIAPVDYLTRPYFDQWAQTYAALMIWSGLATIDELASGHSVSGVAGLGEPSLPGVAGVVHKASFKRYDDPNGPAAVYRVGSRVRTNSVGSTGHTRLPGYLRGHLGKIIASHGPHVLPDANAHGSKRYEPLYTVAFEAAELWPEAAGHRDTVYADLWESYLVAI